MAGKCGVLSLIPLYIIDFKFFCKLNIGLQRKIALAKERGHVARGMIVKEDAKRLVVNNSQSAYSYWAARYTYTVDGKEYRKRFSCDKRHSTRSELRTIINVYWLDDPNKPFWDYSSGFTWRMVWNFYDIVSMDWSYTYHTAVRRCRCNSSVQ